MHIGQHGACDPQGVIVQTVPAKPEGYADLKEELKDLGYILDVRKRITR